MGALFKNQTIRYVDVSGKRVKKGTPRARKLREKSKKWYGDR